jgi:non-ribosomal peptide synthetase component E (peptide arylation enzyme)
MARYSWPERLEVLDEMPISTGEKIAKAELKRRAQ